MGQMSEGELLVSIEVLKERVRTLDKVKDWHQYREGMTVKELQRCVERDLCCARESLAIQRGE